MKKENDDENQIILKSINKKLKSIEGKIHELPKQRENENFFIATILTSLSFVLISISIPLIIQLQEFQKEVLWWTCISYFILAILAYIDGLRGFFQIRKNKNLLEIIDIIFVYCQFF